MASDPNTPPLLPSSPTSRSAVPWRQITWFIVGTFALTWLIVLPLYLVDDGLVFQMLYLPVTVAMMFVPALIAWIIVRKTRPKGQRAAALGFTRHRPLPRFFGYLALAFVLPVVITLISLPLASAFGLFEADVQDFSGIQQLFAAAGVTDMPIGVIMVGQIIRLIAKGSVFGF